MLMVAVRMVIMCDTCHDLLLWHEQQACMRSLACVYCHDNTTTVGTACMTGLSCPRETCPPHL